MVKSLDSVVKIAGMYLEGFGLKNTDVETLRSLSSRTLLATHLKIGVKTGGVTPTEPVLDGMVIQEEADGQDSGRVGLQYPGVMRC